MFCPWCGVKNKDGAGKCFVCEKVLPSGDDSPLSATPLRMTSVPGAPGRPAPRPPDRIAALGDRMIAVLLDMSFAGALMWMGVVWLIAHFDEVAKRFTRPEWVIAAAAGAALVAVFLYYLILEWAAGATIGKGMVGIQVRRQGGKRTGFRESLLRNVLRLADAIGFYLFGFLVAIFSKERQRLGDHAAGTVVVERQPHWALRLLAVVCWLGGLAGGIWGAYQVSGGQFVIPAWLSVRP